MTIRMHVEIDIKVCITCNEAKPVDGFYWRSGRQVRRNECKECGNARSRANQLANPERYLEYSRRSKAKMTRRERTLRYRFGLTGEQFEHFWVEQGSVCAICRGRSGDPTRHVDHCHTTGCFRGILCGLCNRMLGQGKDDPEILIAGADYVRRFAVAVAA